VTKRQPRVAGQRPRQSSDSSSHNQWTTLTVVITAGITAVTALIATGAGMYFNADASKQATQQADQQARQAQAAQRQVQAAQTQERVTQTSERFSRSVEQLGSHSIAVRIGAVYSFGRLMRDSTDDQQAIVEILSSFIRLRAPQVDAVQKNQKTRVIPPDMLAALTVLDAQPLPRTHTSPDGTRAKWPSMHLDGVNLAWFDFHGIAMSGANLSGANLSGANLSGANLNHAELISARLLHAELISARLLHANLFGADLTHAYLFDANLTGADLTDANLRGVACSPSTQWPEDLTPLPRCATR
jgi:hypothetical protein